MKILVTFILLFVFTITDGVSQSLEPLNVSNGSSIEIDGTSTLHDWTAVAKDFTVDFRVPKDWTKGVDFWDAEDIEGLVVTVPVEKLDSGKGGMDKRMYKALKDDDHPRIIFEYSNVELEESDKLDAKNLVINGELTIAGVSKPVSLEVTGEILESNALKFSGSYTMNMTEFDVEPPSAMLGTIKSGEEITIRYDIIFQ